MKAEAWFMAALFGLGLVGNLLARLGCMRATDMVSPAAFRTTVLVWTLVLLAGCGGGDPEPEPDQPTPQVNCALQPVLCK